MPLIDPFKGSLLTDIFKYVAAINPNYENFLERLRISYQLSSVLRDKASNFHDYAESMPTSPKNFPIYWKNSDCTSSVNLRQMIGDEFFLYRNSYDKIFDLEKKTLSNISFEEYTWAHSVAQDKSVTIDGSMNLVPIVDSFPHSFVGNTQCIRDSDCIRVFSCNEIPENTLLTRCYGEFDNYTFALRHGFIPENNPFHRLSVYPENLSNWNEVFTKLRVNDTKLLDERLNSERFSMNSLKKALFQKFTNDGIINCYFPMNIPAKEIEVSFRIFFLNETDLNIRGIKDYKEALELDFSREITPKNEKNVMIMLFKCAELVHLMLSEGFVGSAPEGRRLEEIDKDLVAKFLTHYRNLALSEVSL